MDAFPQLLFQLCGRGSGVITVPKASVANLASRLAQSGLCEIVDLALLDDGDLDWMKSVLVPFN